MASASGSNPPNAAPPKPPVVVPGIGNNIVINPTQRGNPILDLIRNVGKEYGDIPADYQVGRTTGVLFLSLKYHRLHPEYILARIEKLGNAYNLRVLLLQCDVTEHKDPIRELTKVCLINNLTILIAFSKEDAGHYLSTLKQFEHRSPDLIKERVDKSYTAVLRSSLTSISKVNKTDVETLKTTFGSFAGVAKASPEQLTKLPGFGQVKVRNIQNAFHKPVRNQGTSALSQSATQRQAQTGQASLGDATSALASTQSGDKGKGKDSLESGTSAEKPFEPRASSPDWDIELDLNEDEELYL
ncbi:restriction endonuclease type II-like protein [Pterulicium gracile]|uniref:Restriction endonuclease type II-like protein n=1 Tax=Pterulicium gracile TaxID=1884261 RepID=A0A5C3QNL2_9AGAR|nr:restriction endonuclease type II-like protein [Pterula gracilis]